MTAFFPRFDSQAPRTPSPFLITLASCSRQQALCNGRQEGDVPSRQLMEDRWPGGNDSALQRAQDDGNSGDGGPPPGWRDRNYNASGGMVDLARGEAATPQLGENLPLDPFAMERPPILNGGGRPAAAGASGGGEGIGAGEIRAKPQAISRPARYSGRVVNWVYVAAVLCCRVCCRWLTRRS